MTADDPIEYRIQSVEQALAQDGAVAELGLRLTATDATVVVSGTVTTEERRQAVRELVRELLPDLDVREDITLTNLVEPAHEEDVP